MKKQGQPIARILTFVPIAAPQFDLSVKLFDQTGGAESSQQSFGSRSVEKYCFHRREFARGGRSTAG